MRFLNFGVPPTKIVDLGTKKISENTVTEMIKVIKESSHNPLVRAWAEKLIQNVPPRDDMGEAESVYLYVRDHCRYTRDPLGLEYFTTPILSLQKLDRGEIPALDCDDYCLLVASLLRSIGFFTVVRIAGYGADKSDYSHVYCMAKVGEFSDGTNGQKRGKWVALDPIRREWEFGFEAGLDNSLRHVKDYFVDT
jgi:hypothetical protein